MSLNTAQQWVRDFHEKFACRIGNWGHPQIAEKELRAKLLREEFEEFLEAIALKATEDGFEPTGEDENLEDAVDALGDMLYLILGTAVAWGVNLDPILEVIHGANMRKERGGRRADGKILKPPGWEAPDIAATLRAQKRKYGNR